MFGYIIINKPDMKFKEFDVYQSYYCGLCRALKNRHGVWGQASLSYDMTFLYLLLSSLYEPEEEVKTTKCIAHPFEKHVMRTNHFAQYVSDMNILLTYYKCEDDWNDEKKVSKKFYGDLLGSSFVKVKKEYAKKANIIHEKMNRLSEEEKKNSSDLDLMSGLFGEILGEIFVIRDDEWADELYTIGNRLGRFIYLCDAYEDLEEDIKKGQYNPLKTYKEEPDFEEMVHKILTLTMAECSQVFETLPILENAEILRNILYSGVWTRYEMVKLKRKEKENA